MNLVHLVESMNHKRLFLPGIGKLSKVTFYDLDVWQYNSNRFEKNQGDTPCQSETFCNTPIQLNVFQLDFFVVLDINECASATHDCSDNAVCNNTRGSYNCSCKDRFHGDGISYTGNYL